MEKGFTLIELLGVVAVLGIAMAVSIPSLVENNRNAQINARRDFINTLELAAKDYINYFSDPDVCDENDNDCRNRATGLNDIFNVNGNTLNVNTNDLISVNFLKSSLVIPFTNQTLGNQNITINMQNNNGVLILTTIQIGNITFNRQAEVVE